MPIVNQVVQGGGGGSSATEPYFEYEISGGELVGSTTTSHKFNFTGVTRIRPYQFYDGYYNNTVISGTYDLSSINYVSIHGFEGFLSKCSNITSVVFGYLDTVEETGMANMLAESGITNLELDCGVASGDCFSGICSGCSQLTTAKIYTFSPSDDGQWSNPFSYAFSNCSSLANVYFYDLEIPSAPDEYDNNFQSMFSDCNNVTVHFPMKIEQSITDNIGDMPNFASGFDGTNTTILYDIVTQIVGNNSITYDRAGKTSTADSWVDQNTGYYVYTPRTDLGPSVNDTIYSDAACTQALTTIAAIA